MRIQCIHQRRIRSFPEGRHLERNMLEAGFALRAWSKAGVGEHMYSVGEGRTWQAASSSVMDAGEGHAGSQKRMSPAPPPSNASEEADEDMSIAAAPSVAAPPDIETTT